MGKKILSFSEIIWDIYSDKSFIGGAGLNFAVHCKKCGADSYIFSAVGNDELGKKTSEVVSEFQINTDFVKTNSKSTGKCTVTLDEHGVPNFNVHSDTAYDNIEVTDEDIAKINSIGFDALYFGTLIRRSEISRKSLDRLCKECNFNEIICDVNLRKDCYDKESVTFCFEHSTVLKISDEDEKLLREFSLYDCSGNEKDICKSICENFPQIKYVILTLGEKGSFIYCSETDAHFTENAQKVKVASTVGAGDSFTAAWVTSYLSGKTITEATALAAQLSGFVVSKTGAIPEYSIKSGVICTPDIYTMHTHTHNSHDSNENPENYIKIAIENNIAGFAVTDHCDIEFYKEHNQPIPMINSFNETKLLADKYKDKVKILKGVEIGEGIWDKKLAAKTAKALDYDVVIGSVHAVRLDGYTAPYSLIDFTDVDIQTIEEFLDVYFDDVYETVCSIDCDIMAHLTCPVRYLNGKYNKNVDVRKYQAKITKILEYIIEHSIAMEINTSGVDNVGFMPDKWIIKQFRDMGGELITIGSDAHIAENFDKGLEDALAFLKSCGFTHYYYYENRKPVRCEL